MLSSTPGERRKNKKKLTVVVVFVTRSIIDITVFPMHIWKPVRKLKDKYRLRYEQKKKKLKKILFSTIQQCIRYQNWHNERMMYDQEHALSK